MVINIGALKSGQNELVESDIKAVVDASGDKLVKVIIETCLPSYDEKVQACQLAKLAGADFVKTSTGFSTGGATIEDVELMREVVDGANDPEDVGEGLLFLPVRIKCQSAVALFFG